MNQDRLESDTMHKVIIKITITIVELRLNLKKIRNIAYVGTGQRNGRTVWQSLPRASMPYCVLTRVTARR